MNIFYIPDPHETPKRVEIIDTRNTPTEIINTYKPIEHRPETFRFDNFNIEPSKFLSTSLKEHQAYTDRYNALHHPKPSEEPSISYPDYPENRNPDNMDDRKKPSMAN